jgi:hypothetical protein
MGEERVASLAISTREPQWWEPIVKFLVEILTGCIIFALITGAAIGLSLAVITLERLQLDRLTIGGLRLAEYSLSVSDFVLFGRFLRRASCRAWSSL